MKYVILINPKDEIEIKEYRDYHTLNDLVDGWYENCGHFVADNKLCMLFCNEEFLFQDNCAFNAIGTTLAAQPIYGNIVVTIDGYNDEGERDSLPMDYSDAQSISAVLNDLKVFIASILEELKSKYNDKKPLPKYEVVSSQEEFIKKICFGDKEEQKNL